MISKKIIQKGFLKILKTRLVEEFLSKEYSKNEIRCPMHLSIGQEAISAGVALNLKNNDQAVSNHRCHSHYLSLDGSLFAMFGELYGKLSGSNGGRGGSMNLLDIDKKLILSLPIVASTIPIGVGLSLEKKINNKNDIIYIYLGDAATEEGVFYESLNFAKLFDLKCIFIIENNLYSVYTHINERRKSGLKEIKNILGIKTINGNGMNFNDVYKKVKKAADYVTKNSKPVITIFNTYRWLEHCGPNNDDHLNYRNKKEILIWRKRCPLKEITNYVLRKKIFTKNEISKMEIQIENEIINTLKKIKKSKFPKSSEAITKIYAK